MGLFRGKNNILHTHKLKKNSVISTRSDGIKSNKKTVLEKHRFDSDDETYFSSTSFTGFSGDDFENEKNRNIDTKNINATKGNSGHVLNLKKKIKQKKPLNKKRHIMYVGRLSAQFTEDDLLKYFDQFGKVINIRISRNKKTGNSKHYGFVEFQNNSSLRSAYLSMNNYLVHGHQLQCQIIDNNNIPENLFMNSNKKYHPMSWQKISKYLNDREKPIEHMQVLKKKYLCSKTIKKAHLQSKGIFYDFENFL